MDRSGEISVKELMANIHSNGMLAIKPVYIKYRDDYLAFSSRYTQDHDLRLQSLHDGIIQLYEALMAKKYDESKSSLKTYLFNLAKYRLLNRLRKESNISRPFDSERNGRDNGEEMQPFQEISEASEEMKRAFDTLGGKCKDLLIHFFYESLDTKEVMRIMGYDSENVVYAAKSRCLKKLKELVIQNRERTKSAR